LLLFGGPSCEAVCGDIEILLQHRKIDYALVDIAAPEGAKYGVHQHLLTYVGYQRFNGYKEREIKNAVAAIG
jgi:hypothetical protein